MEPREYQQAAFDAVIADLKTHKRVVVEVPCGGGKSLLAAMLAARVADAAHKVWIITNRKELLEQNSATLGKLRPDLANSTGIVSAGLNRDDRDADVLFGGVSSISARMSKMSMAQKTVALLIIDEAHLVRPDDGQFQAVIKELNDINPDLRVVGLTASPYRLDLGPIAGEGAPFEKVSYQVSMRLLIDRGFLVPLECYAPKDAGIDMTGVRTVAGEYNQRDLEDAAIRALKSSAGDAARRLTADLAGQKSIIVFCSGVDHAKAVARLFNEAGIPSAAVSGEDPVEERDAKIAAFKSGQLRAIMNVAVLTTGFDHPPIDTVVDLRPTKSPVLYVQTRGRAGRAFPGKQRGIVLDYSGNTHEHGPLDQVSAPNKPGKGKGKAVVKTCPNCDHIEPGGAATCSACGHQFEIKRGGNLSHVPLAGDAISLTSARWLPVARMSWAINPGKDGKPPTLRLDFRCNGNIGTRQSMYLSLEMKTANGYAYTRSADMWRRMSASPNQPPPKTVVEAVMRAKTGELRQPKYIYAVPDGKYTRIDQVAFETALGARP